jgi:BNR repeat-like domain
MKEDVLAAGCDGPRGSLRSRIIAVTVVAGALLAGAAWTVAPTAAQSVAGSPPRPQLVSVPSPFAPLDCGQAALNNFARADSTPFEPMVAVNPANRDNIVVTYIQDLFLLNMIRVSNDGGNTWTTVLVPGLTLCNGGSNQAAGDPSLAFSADGKVLYLASLVASITAPHGPAGVAVSRSFDGGLHWSSPQFLEPPEGPDSHDVNFIKTDPTRPGSAYLAWPIRDAAGNLTGDLEYSRTDDSGQSWSTPRVIYSLAGGNDYPIASQIFRMKDGSLVDIFQDTHSTASSEEIIALRSTDDGATWTKSASIAQEPLVDIATVSYMNDFPSAAQDSGGRVYVSIPFVASGGVSRIVVTSSSDGVSWSALRTAARGSTPTSVPALAAQSGSLALTYYQLSPQPASDGSVMASLLFTSSRDGGSTWRAPQPVAGPFSVNGSSGDPFGYLGDYEGISPAGNRAFVAAFELCTPMAHNGRTDIFFARLQG